jgi:hypothetical protein
MKLIMENWRKFVDSCEADSELIEEKKTRVKKSKKKKKKSFPDLTGDGKVTRADILKGRGVIDEEEIEEKKTKKYDDHPNLKGKQASNLPDHLQKAIIGEDDELEEGFSGNGPLAEPIEEKKKKRKKKKPCKPSKGKRFAKRVNGKCRSFGQKGKAKGGGDRIRPGTKKGDAYCARSAKIKKCKNPPCANALSRKKWKCRGSKSMAE